MESSDLEGFDEFWKIYPRRVARLYAMRCYKRALKITSAARILEGAKAYAKAQEGKDQQFTAHPSSWLNGGRWSDYEVAPSYSGTAVSGFYATFTSAELDAWNVYGRQTKGMNYPADKRGGWWFPTQWPP